MRRKAVKSEMSGLIKACNCFGPWQPSGDPLAFGQGLILEPCFCPDRLANYSLSMFDQFDFAFFSLSFSTILPL